MRRRDLVLAPTALWAQTDADVQRSRDGQRTVMQVLQREAALITDQAIAELATRGSWERVREQRRREMRDMLGLEPLPKRTPLNVRVTGVLDKDFYTVEKIAFEAMPKFYVTGNLYVPKQRDGRVPGVIYVCGHSHAPQGAKAMYRRHGVSLARNGYVAFVLDPIQLAETYGLHHGPYGLGTVDWYARGYTPAGPEVWNAMRAIDYLETRPEVDAARIGMTGRSGGAAMTWFTAAVDERVKVAAPVMGISTYRANVKANTQKGHCDCMFPVNFARHDMMHQGALIAPRPLLMAHGIQDALFPVEGYQEFEKHVGKLYEAYGVRQRFANVEVNTGHQDSDFLRETAIAWFDRFLWPRQERKLDLEVGAQAAETLAVFGGTPPADAVNFRVQEEFNPRAKRTSAQLLAWVKGLALDAHAAPEIAVQKAKDAAAPRLLYVASTGDDAESLGRLFRSATSKGEDITRMVVYPRGTGPAPWPASFVRDVERNAMHVGWTLDSLRLSDVLAALRKLKSEGTGRISVMGRGLASGLALYAAILDADVAQAIMMEPSVSHRQGPCFLNVLRETDLPEVAGLLAPRRLSFWGKMPEEYTLTKRIFTQLDVTEKLYEGVNLDGIVTGRYGHGYGSGF